jgi:glycine hydroxymethyltransferase
VYDVFARPGDTVMGMSLMHGGHLTHGSEFNRSGRQYRIVSYEVDPSTGRLDYDRIAGLAREHRPRMIIAGYTSYPWAPDWKRFREICDQVGAVLFADIAHTAGMVAAGAHPSPVGYADVITCTTHKSLFGPRGALVITTEPEHAAAVDQAVFPGEQGGPHVNKFAAMAVAFALAMDESYVRTQHAVVENAALLARCLQENGLRLAYGGTDTHLVLVDLKGVTSPGGNRLLGETAVRVLDLAGITANKNTIPGDAVTAEATGVRLGTPWITQRGITQEGIRELAAVIARLLQGIHPFSYMGLTGTLPRGKVELGLLQEARERTAALAAGLAAQGVDKTVRAGRPAGGSAAGVPGGGEGAGAAGAAHGGRDAASGDRCWLQVRGERAVRFLDVLCTGRVHDLEAGSTRLTLLLDPDGRLLAPVTIGKLPPGGRPEEDAFLLSCRRSEAEKVARWLEGNADGYVLFDRRDLFRKVDGPVVIEEQAGPPGVTGAGGRESSTVPLPPDLLPGTCPGELLAAHPELFAREKPYFAGKPALHAGSGGGDAGSGEGKMLFRWESPGGGGPGGRREGDTPGSGARSERGEPEPKPSCLFEEHGRLGAAMVDFAGWNMPVRYSGILEEHRAVRERAGLFDISHMGVLEVSGERAQWFLDLVLSNYLPWIGDGESQYGYLLDVDGGVIDDVMVYRDHRHRYLLVVNAVNAAKDLAWLRAVNRGEAIVDRNQPEADIPREVEIRNLKDEAEAGGEALVNLALQGPASRTVLLELVEGEGAAGSLRRLEKSRFMRAGLAGVEAVVSRTGYTGEELGYELLVHSGGAARLWRSILKDGESQGVVPVGLGARDSLRTEAGLPLHGHELAGPYDIDPLEAGFGPYVKLHKAFFVGREPLLRRMSGPGRAVIRFKVESRGVRPLKIHDWVVSARTQQVIGNVTSCAVVPGGRQVGMACVDRRHAREGLALGIIPAAAVASGGQEKGGGLRLGGKFPLPVQAVVAARFPERP